jgi:hypothetical protein
VCELAADHEALATAPDLLAGSLLETIGAERQSGRN